MKNEKLEKTSKRFPLWARWIITSLLVILVVILMFILMKPLRIYSSHKFSSAGDNYLAQNKYLHADLAYEKALILSPKDTGVMAKRALAKEASENIVKLESFYNSFSDKKALFDSAVSFPKTETDAVKLSKQLIEQGEYQLAAIPAETATQMDPGYFDAWFYLGIANLRTAQLVELSPEIRQKYLDMAREALKKAKEIDPESKAVAEYLKMI